MKNPLVRFLLKEIPLWGDFFYGKVEKTYVFWFIKSPAGEGRSYAEVRTELTSLVPETSDAVSLWIYARGGVLLYGLLLSPPELTDQSRANA